MLHRHVSTVAQNDQSKITVFSEGGGRVIPMATTHLFYFVSSVVV